MFESSTIIAYLISSAAIIIAPGPAQALVLAVTFSGGKKAGVLTVLGLNSSIIIHVTAAAIGISTILAASSLAFSIVKFAGAAYLIFIGMQSILQKKESENKSNLNSKVSFSKAIITGILNPKVALFFLAFVPQFINPGQGMVFLQFITLGLILAVMDIIYESTLVLIAHSISSRLINNSRFASLRRKITGTVMVALGLRIALLTRE